MRLAELALTEAALKKYNGNVENVVFITTVTVKSTDHTTQFFAIAGFKVIHAPAFEGGDTLVQISEGKSIVFAVGEAFKYNWGLAPLARLADAALPVNINMIINQKPWVSCISVPVPDYTMLIARDACGTLEFDRADEKIALGYETAARTLSRL